MGRVTTVLFDLDGTLIDTFPDYIRVVRQHESTYGKVACSDQNLRDYFSYGLNAVIAAAYPGVAKEKIAAIRATYLRASEAGTETQLFDTAAELLDYLEVHNIPWGIVTGKARNLTEVLLKKFHLLDRCAVLICADDTKLQKPSPEPLLKACSILGCAANASVWYVGDHNRDIIAAQAADMSTILVLGGYISTELQPIAQQNADYVVDGLASCLSLLKKQLT